MLSLLCPTTQVKRQFRLSCDRLLSISSCNGTLWCCEFRALAAAFTRVSRVRADPGNELISLSVFLFRRQGRCNGGVEERLSQTSPDSAGATKRIHDYVQLCAAVTRGTPTPPPISVFVSLLILDSVNSFYPCLCQREELWSSCMDSGEICIWHIKDTNKPFHRMVLPDCSGCCCMIKVKNQVNIQH